MQKKVHSFRKLTTNQKVLMMTGNSNTDAHIHTQHIFLHRQIVMLVFILMLLFILNTYFSTGNDIEPYTGFEIHMMAPKVNSDENHKRFCRVFIVSFAIILISIRCQDKVALLFQIFQF